MVVMKKLGFLIFVIALSLPLLGLAQEAEAEDLDSYIARLNTECPIECGENWTFLSLSPAGDTVTVELQVPASLGSFMSLLTSDTDNVRRLWGREISGFGEQWKRFLARLADADRYLKLYFIPKGSEATYVIVLNPAEARLISNRNNSVSD